MLKRGKNSSFELFYAKMIYKGYKTVKKKDSQVRIIGRMVYWNYSIQK